MSQAVSVSGAAGQVGRRTVTESLCLVNDCHSTPKESNLGKSAFDGAVMSSVFVVLATVAYTVRFSAQCTMHCVHCAATLENTRDCAVPVDAERNGQHATVHLHESAAARHFRCAYSLR